MIFSRNGRFFNRVLLLIFTVLFLYTCERLDIVKIVKIETIGVDSVFYHQVILNGALYDLGKGLILEHGHCWATHPDPSMFDVSTFHSSLGPVENPSGFIDTVYGLLSATKYYYRAYCSDGIQMYYGDIKEFTTATTIGPSVNTISVEFISADTAVCTGNVLEDGGESIIERGICWNTLSNPTIDSPHSVSENETSSFSCTLRELQPGTGYHARAYARNSIGISYGNDFPFTTKDGKPVLSTVRITDITTNSALAVSTLEGDGGYPVISRGICWSLSQSLTADDNPIPDGSVTGPYTSAITGLAMNTYYFVRAYAENKTGVHYGNILSFKSVPAGINAVFEKLEDGFAPIIDGSEDDVWGNVLPVMIEKVFAAEFPTVTAYWKGMFDDTCLYVLINVEDDDNYPFWRAGTGPIWDYDRAELYLDLNYNLADGQGPDLAYSGHWQAPADIGGADDYTHENYHSFNDTEYEGRIVSNYQSYRLNGENCTYEFRIPLAYLTDKNATPFAAMNLNEKVFGFDITITDWDEGISTRRHRKAWWNNLNGDGYESWYNMDIAGKIVFR